MDRFPTRFPTLNRLRPAGSELPKIGDAEVDVALHEAQLWFHSLQGHIATLYDDPPAAVRDINKCVNETKDWLTLLSLRVAKYRRYHARPAPGAPATDRPDDVA
jgi:hypothetical protein